MPIPLSKRTQVPGSAIRLVLQQIPKLNEERKEQKLPPIINLSIGQPHLKANPLVIEKLKQELDAKDLSFDYSLSVGRSQTLDEIVKLYNVYYPHAKFTKDEVMVTTGASQALWNVFSILMNPGDTVVTFAPYFSTYKSQIETLGGQLKTVPTLHNQFRPDAKQLNELLSTPDCCGHFPKMVILNYPNNPTGVSLTREEATALADVLMKHPDVAIVIDDVYRDLNYQQHITVFDVRPELRDRCILINSGAKGLIGAPDMRVGMVSAKADWIKAMGQQQLLAISGVPYLTQAATIHAIRHFLENPSNPWLETIKHEYQSNIAVMKDELKKIGFDAVSADGAFYLFVNAKFLIGKEIPEALQKKLTTQVIRNDIDIANYFLHAAGVAMVQGSGFGENEKEGYLRISCARDKAALIQAAKQMQTAMQQLKIVKPVVRHSAMLETGLMASFGLFAGVWAAKKSMDAVFSSSTVARSFSK